LYFSASIFPTKYGYDNIILRYAYVYCLYGRSLEWLNSSSAKHSLQLRNTKPNIPPIFSGSGMLKTVGVEFPVKNGVLWQELYAAAMLELDSTRLQGRIEAAREAIQTARRKLANDDRNAATVAEMRAMADALQNLQTLQRVEFRTSMLATSQGQALPDRCPQ
jgi:hypothetical protein